MSLLQINSIEDLERILLLQKLLSRKAKQDLTGIEQTAMLHDDAFRLQAERILLLNYTNGPTLTEFNIMPNSIEGVRWGATFGVTVLVQSLILDRIDIAQTPELKPLLRPLLILLLSELSNPQNQSLIDPLKDKIKFSIQVNGKELEGTEREAFIERFLTDILQKMLLLLRNFNLTRLTKFPGSKEQGWQITPLGQKVHIHLLDTKQFIQAVAEAHKRLQDKRPQLSMV